MARGKCLGRLCGCVGQAERPVEELLTCSRVDGGEPQQEVQGAVAEVVGGGVADGRLQQRLVEAFSLHQGQPLQPVGAGSIRASTAAPSCTRGSHNKHQWVQKWFTCDPITDLGSSPP